MGNGVCISIGLCGIQDIVDGFTRDAELFGDFFTLKPPGHQLPVSALLTPSCQVHPTMRYSVGLRVEIYPGTAATGPYNHPRSWHREVFL